MDDELDGAKTLGIAEAGGGKRRSEPDEFGREKKRARSKTPKEESKEKTLKVSPEELARQRKLANEVDEMIKELEEWRNEPAKRREELEKALDKAELAEDKELAASLKLQIDEAKREESEDKEEGKLTRTKLLQEFATAERTKADEKGIDNRFKNLLSLARSTGIEQHRLKELEDFHAFLKRRQPRDKKHVKLGGTPPNPFAKFLNKEEAKETEPEGPKALSENSTAEEVRQFAKELAEEIEELEHAHKEEKRIDLLGELLAKRSGKEHVKARQLETEDGFPNRDEELEPLGNRLKVSLSEARKGKITTNGTRLFEMQEYRDFLRKRERKDDLVRLGSDFVPPNPFGYLFEDASGTSKGNAEQDRSPRIPYKLKRLMQKAGEEALEEIRHPEAATKKYAEEIEKLELKSPKRRSELLAEFRKKRIEEELWKDPKLDPTKREVELDLTSAMASAKKGNLKDEEQIATLKAYRAFLTRKNGT